MPAMPYETIDNIWVMLTIERDLDLMHHERFVYTFFDLLSDIGGLSGILTMILASVSSMWNFNSFDHYMMSRLFKIKKPKD